MNDKDEFLCHGSLQPCAMPVAQTLYLFTYFLYLYVCLFFRAQCMVLYFPFFPLIKSNINSFNASIHLLLYSTLHISYCFKAYKFNKKMNVSVRCFVTYSG